MKPGIHPEYRTVLFHDIGANAFWLIGSTASTDKTQPVVVRAVTLEMTPEETEILVKAQTEGKLQLALRNPLDNQKKPLPPVEKAVAVVEVPAPAPVAKPVVRRSSGGGSGVTIIRGIDVQAAKAQL